MFICLRGKMKKSGCSGLFSTLWQRTLNSRPHKNPPMGSRSAVLNAVLLKLVAKEKGAVFILLCIYQYRHGLRDNVRQALLVCVSHIVSAGQHKRLLVSYSVFYVMAFCRLRVYYILSYKLPYTIGAKNKC